jgi:hypothetical protein
LDWLVVDMDDMDNIALFNAFANLATILMGVSLFLTEQPLSPVYCFGLELFLPKLEVKYE